jgi:hypothetical protein
MTNLLSLSEVKSPFIYLVVPLLLDPIVYGLTLYAISDPNPIILFSYIVVASVSLILAVAALIYGIFPLFIKPETLFRKKGYRKGVLEYQFVKKYLFVVIPFYISILIIGNFYPPTPEEMNYIFLESIVSKAVIIGGILRFITQVVKGEFRFYFARACCKIISEKENDFEKTKYLRLLLQSYNKYLERNLRITIKDLNEIYSIILYKGVEERSQILNNICNSLEGEKLSLAKYLSSIDNVPDSKFYAKESLIQELKIIGVILVTAIPIIISIIQLILKK